MSCFFVRGWLPRSLPGDWHCCGTGSVFGSHRHCLMECSQPSEVDIPTAQMGNSSSEKLSAVGKGRVGQMGLAAGLGSHGVMMFIHSASQDGCGWCGEGLNSDKRGSWRQVLTTSVLKPFSLSQLLKPGDGFGLIWYLFR